MKVTLVESNVLQEVTVKLKEREGEKGRRRSSVVAVESDGGRPITGDEPNDIISSGCAHTRVHMYTYTHHTNTQTHTQSTHTEEE